MCIIARHNRPYLLVGWLWFTASLLPVIGLLQVAAQSMADRYSYIPSIGLLVAIVWYAAEWYDRQKSIRPFLVTIGACVTLALLPMTYHQIGLWKNDLTLFTYTSSVTQDNWMAEGIVAQALATQGDLEDAAIHLRRSLIIYPDGASHDIAALKRLRNERLPGEADYAREVRANPADPGPHYNWGNLLLRGGRPADAVIHYRLYLDARPNDLRAQNNLAIALATIGALPEAEEEFAKAIELDPTNPDGHCGLGTVLLREAKYGEAAASYEHALELNPAMQAAQIGLNRCRSKLRANQTGS